MHMDTYLNTVDPEYRGECRELLKDVDFSKLRMETINDTIFYYHTDNWGRLPDDVRATLSKIPKSEDSWFVELINGDLVIS